VLGNVGSRLCRIPNEMQVGHTLMYIHCTLSVQSSMGAA
jgi:hypothetical protein